MIEHDEARLSLADLIVPGLADPTRSAALKAHVAVCQQCRAELLELRRLDALVRACGPMPQASPGLQARILQIPGPTAQRRPLAILCAVFRSSVAL